MIELLVRIVDKTSDDKNKDIQLTKRGDVIAWHLAGEDWGTQELSNPEWRIIKADITEADANALLAPELPTKLGTPNEILKKRAVKLDVDSLAISSDTKQRVDDKATILSKPVIVSAVVVKDPTPQADVIGTGDDVIGPTK